ncbi:exoribonuclease, putative [Plasmodium ovale curtisi]|uniref:Exoribonuclease, putative n=1 Tax=Plasmodium ovale curtisi TaxID=864141 RepID=A0A1A8VZW7_PLAOA|nr:exoribonuclease, putative [Plasmodium ovale curtisi]
MSTSNKVTKKKVKFCTGKHSEEKSMGVPTFYRWLVTRYPKVAKAVYETRDSDVYARRVRIEENGDFFKVHDLSSYVNNTDEKHCSDNVNGYYDNLYLDMNGIIHLCSHGDSCKQAKSDEEIFINIFLYVERLFDIIEPKKLLYMAIDGVAPKAKMNQQRSRRFKSILCSEIEKRAYIELREKFLAENRMVPEEIDYWDSNIITPGTQFMHDLSVALKYFIEHKITNDEKWKKIVVIFSDANVCGEGEHKIYNFIKSQRAQKGFDPNTRHIIHGMDADLIMLSLASHEPYFYILREIIQLETKEDDKPPPKIEYVGILKSKEDLHFCRKVQERRKNVYNKYNDPNYANVSIKKKWSINYENWNELQILDLTILREYLSKDFFFDSRFNLERCIDDFIFICFLCGNDFLPHLPSISIASGSIDQLVLLYQKVLPVLDDYLINEGSLNLNAFTKYVSFIAEIERETFVSQYFFKKKREKRELQKDSLKRVKSSDKENDNSAYPDVIIDSVEDISNNVVGHASSNMQVKVQEDSSQHFAQSTTGSGQIQQLASAPGNVSKKQMYETKIQSMQPIRNFKYKEKKGEKSINFLVRPVSNISEQVHNEQEMAQNNQQKDEQMNDCNRNENDVVEEEPKSDIVSQQTGNTGYQLETITHSNKANAVVNNTLSEERKELIDITEFNLLLKEAIKKANECEHPREDVELGSDENPDDIRVKYYRAKFHLDENDYIEDFIKEVVYKYIEGLAWVLAYYFQSCPMWHWFYPYYYAPLSSDLIIKDINISFEKDEPLLPFEQLLSVLPSNSSHCLPKMYRELMTSRDSPIIDFYPTTYKEEENGKKYKYQWVVILPFVDKERIIKHARALEDTLTEQEKKRNRRGMNRIYVNSTHVLSKQITKSIKTYIKQIKKKESETGNIGVAGEMEEGDKDAEEPRDVEEAEAQNGDGTLKEDVSEKKKKKGSIYDHFFKNMNITMKILSNKDINLFGYLNCKHEDSDVDVLKKIFKFSSNFSTACNSAFFLQPEFKKHESCLLPNHVKPKKVLTVLDINNEERKLRFNAPAARKMILNSLSTNHPHIYSFSRDRHNRSLSMNQVLYGHGQHGHGQYGHGQYGHGQYGYGQHGHSQHGYVQHSHGQQNLYANEQKVKSSHNYASYNSRGNRENTHGYNSMNPDSYMKIQKSYSHQHNQNYQNPIYNNNYPPLPHNKQSIPQKLSKYGSAPHTYDSRRDGHYINHGSYGTNTNHAYHGGHVNQKSAHHRDNPNYESPHPALRHSGYNNYVKHKHEKPTGGHMYNAASSYHNGSRSGNHRGMHSGNYGGNHLDEGTYYTRDSFKANASNVPAVNKKTSHYNRSMPYKDKE